ncbi:uncharacterized protein [Onthophagus taurus]|uniref:uncharacterized protein n=1 Tax=Onthophagus taurus TaxID=166361 RepID=UPI0039BE4339
MAENTKLSMSHIHELNGEVLVNRLREWGFIPKEGEYKCPECETPLVLQHRSNGPDGYVWACNGRVSIRKQKKRKCAKTVSFRNGTIFANSRLEIRQILGFVYLWVEKTPLTVIAKVTKMSLTTAVGWASFFREVLLDKYLLHPEILGGPGSIVEIDESQFGRRKYHRGHPVEGQWVIGGHERGTGRVFMEIVEERTADTLVPIIKKWILPGTTIISDYWTAHDCLKRNGYVDLKVNHSITFKDPESTSRHAKIQLPGNFARYIFHKTCEGKDVEKAEEFYRIAAMMYDPTKPAQQRDPEEVVDEYPSDNADD